MIFGPMRQVGCASACSGVTSSSSARVRPRNGPPEPVSTSVSTCSGSRPSRHWKSAECSLSTGRIRPPPRSRAARASSPAATRLSLFASARSTPRSSAQSVAWTPAKPTTALRTTSGSRALEQLGQVAADLLQRRVDVVERRRAGGGGAELELRDAPRRSRSPGGRSSRWRRAARRVSPAKCREQGALCSPDERRRSRRAARGSSRACASNSRPSPPSCARSPARSRSRRYWTSRSQP